MGLYGFVTKLPQRKYALLISFPLLPHIPSDP